MKNASKYGLLIAALIFVGLLWGQIDTLPHQESFDAVEAPALPEAWSSCSAGANAYVRTDNYNPLSPPNSARIYNGNSLSSGTILIAPPVHESIAMNQLRVRFVARRLDRYVHWSLGIMTDPLDPASFTEIEYNQVQPLWNAYIVSLSSYTGSGRYIALRHHDFSQDQAHLFIDDFALEYIPQYDLGIIGGIYGNTTPSLAVPSNYQVTVRNLGTSPMANYSLQLYRLDGTVLASTDGIALQPGQEQSHTVGWTPQSQGIQHIYARIVSAVDQFEANDQSPILQVYVLDSPVIPPPPPPGQQIRFPLDFYWKNSLGQYLYYPSMIGNFQGLITGINLYNDFSEDLGILPTRIWIGTTTLMDLSAGWIPSTELTLVFDGSINYPLGTNQIHYEFMQPFPYLNGQNLVLMFQRPFENSYYNSTNYFICYYTTPLIARKLNSDTIIYDPANPPATGGSLEAYYPATNFLFSVSVVSNLQGTITDLAGSPLGGVEVTIESEELSVTSAVDGSYYIPYLPAGEYLLKFSRPDYLPYYLNIYVLESGTMVQDASLTPWLGSLSGVVQNESAHPIVEALVQAGAFSVLTGPNGEYHLPLQAGNYSVSISAPNYEPQDFDVTVMPDTDTQINATLILISSEPDTELVSVADALLSPYPNPFRTQTAIPYVLKEAGLVKIDIYNARGQFVRSLVDANQPGGRHEIRWDARDMNGKAVRSGVYFYRMRVGDRIHQKKLLLITQ